MTPANPIEWLAEVGREYRRIRAAHGSEAVRGTTRRRLRGEMERRAERFERLLEHWVPDAQLREAWRAYLYRGADRPTRPRVSAPPLFRGRTETGAVIEIHQAPDGGYDITHSGAHTHHHEVPWHLEPEAIEPIQVGPWACDEIFVAPDAAVAALREYLDRPGTTPPWRWARELYEDGLMDVDFGLTPRGARRLGETAVPGAGARAGRDVCVLVANAARARVLMLASRGSAAEARVAQLVEVADTSHAEARARDSERFTETRPGLRREGAHAPRHAVSDRREQHRREHERRFLEVVVEEAEQVWSQLPGCTVVVAASPRVLGMLRPSIARRVHGNTRHAIVELRRDLTQLAAPALHDALARAEILPPRARLPPVVPMRTPNPWQGR